MLLLCIYDVWMLAEKMGHTLDISVYRCVGQSIVCC
jgi:hypothetical protein